MLEFLLAELKKETKATLRLIQALPDDQLSWKPHEKSFSLGGLALHMAQSLESVLKFIEAGILAHEDMSFDFPEAESKDQILKTFEENAEQARTTLESWGEEGLLEKWKFTKGGETLSEIPRAMILRTVFFNHLYHHRGQLTVYLRLLDVPVPSIYGPTSDVDPYDR